MAKPKTFPFVHAMAVWNWQCAWNWKCALLSATVRSLLYLLAMAHGVGHGRWIVIAVEMAYVTLTAGLWAGMQQMALGMRSRLSGNLMVVLLVPGLSQLCDGLVHRAVGAAAPTHAVFAACFFTLLSALFHLHVMRNGAFLTGQGRSLAEDFRRLPRLVAQVCAPVIKRARMFESGPA